MKNLCIITLLLFYVINIDAQVYNVPAKQTSTSKQIADFISSKNNTEENKILAAYLLVTNNIRYDHDSMYAINWGKEKDEVVAATLRRRKGVCENYAVLFADIISEMNIKCYVVHGVSRQGGFINWNGHTWVAVFTNNKWLLCDPTWDAGNTQQQNYFFAEPDIFFQTHIPFDPLWQLSYYPLSNEDIIKGRSTQKIKSYFNYKDSISLFLSEDSTQQYSSIAQRMLRAGLDNEMLQTWYKYIVMYVNIIKNENEMEIYNAAVDDYNKATSIYNEYASYFNNMFKPAKPDTAIKAMLDPAIALVNAAYLKTDKLSTGETSQYNPWQLKERMDRLQVKLKTAQEFLIKYLMTDEGKREDLFTK